MVVVIPAKAGIQRLAFFHHVSDVGARTTKSLGSRLRGNDGSKEDRPSYQMCTRCSGARHIGWPGFTPKAW
jgi:hypothetical protein